MLGKTCSEFPFFSSKRWNGIKKKDKSGKRRSGFFFRMVSLFTKEDVTLFPLQKEKKTSSSVRQWRASASNCVRFHSDEKKREELGDAASKNWND